MGHAAGEEADTPPEERMGIDMCQLTEWSAAFARRCWVRDLDLLQL